MILIQCYYLVSKYLIAFSLHWLALLVELNVVNLVSRLLLGLGRFNVKLIYQLKMHGSQLNLFKWGFAKENCNFFIDFSTIFVTLIG